MSLCKSKVVHQRCRNLSVESKKKRKKVGEGGGWRGPQRIAPFHSTVPDAPSWAGTNWCEIKFQVGYNDPGRSHTHPWISRIGKGRFLSSELKVIIWSWTVWLLLSPDGTKISCFGKHSGNVVPAYQNVDRCGIIACVSHLQLFCSRLHGSQGAGAQSSTFQRHERDP